MRKIFLIGAIACMVVGITSCATIKKKTISTTHFLNEVNDVNSSITKFGYSMSGKSSVMNNDIFVAATSYNLQTGYGSALANNSYYCDWYKFTDDAKNTASYQMRYKFLKDDRDGYGVSDVSVLGCEVSNPKDFEKICGDSGAVQKLNRIEPEQTSTFDDSERNLITFIVFSTITLTAGLAYLLNTAL